MHRVPWGRVPALVVLPSAVILASCAEGDGPRSAVPSRILFHSERDGDREIYVMNADGSEPLRLTFHSASDMDPDVSPDGRRLVFTSNRTGDDDIFVMDLEGGEPVNLTSSPGRDGWARWSPDGRRIAFHSDRDGNSEIYVMDSDGSGATRVTDYAGDDLFPEWSADGTRLLFRRDQDVWIAGLDGGDAQPLTDAEGLDQMAVVSPDGESIAFMSFREGYCSIFVMNPDGSDPRSLTPKDEGDADEAWCSRYPAWGRDGRIFFASWRPATNGDEEVFVMNADGSGVTRLTTSPGRDFGPRPF